MPKVGASELAYMLSLMLTFSAWAYILTRGGSLRIQLLLALLATLLPVIGPVFVFLCYRPRTDRKRE